jgi:ankyrin repeat protein
MILAGLLGLPLWTGPALATDVGSSSLVDAAKDGDRDAVRALLDASARDVRADAAALIAAAERNDLTTVDLLLNSGADPSAANEYGATALYAAAANADPAVTRRLLAAGADVNAHLLSGESALMKAAERGNLEVVGALLAAGADPNAQESNGGQNALMWAIAERHADVANELIKHGADVGARSQAGSTALMFAARQGDSESTRILLGAEANPNDVMPKTSATALLIAGAMGQPDVVMLLLDHGADPNAIDANGFTALHHAIWSKAYVTSKTHASAHRAEWNRDALVMIKALLAHGAKPNVRLVQKKPTLMVSGISMSGATPLALAAEINNLEAVKLLVDAGADPLVPTEKGTTPLILAAGAGVDLSNSRSPEERATALETIKYLVAHGADVNAAGEFGWTALHAAAFQGLNHVIAYLVSQGANPDAKDQFAQTPLSISYAIVTREGEQFYYQSPHIRHDDTADLLQKLGATPLEKSGVVVAAHR